MSQYQNAPGASQEEFDNLSEQMANKVDKSDITTVTATFTTNSDSNIDFGAGYKKVLAVYNNTYYCQMIFWFNGNTFAKMKNTINGSDIPNTSMTITYVTYNV